MENKWVRAAIPALLIHCSIGSVYCWSTFKECIAKQIGTSTFSTGWAFSLAIFFLGMSAAFFGKIIEKNIQLSSLISCICFSIGMIGTGLCINFLKGLPALIGIYTCYGCIMGIGLGVGYLTPVKTLMLWFSDRKGLATGISIMGFGLAKAIATPIMEKLQSSFGISKMFYILGGIYFAMMFIGHLLLKKPKGWIENPENYKDFNVLSIFKDKIFRNIWIMFYLNIHCGLMLISYEKQIVSTFFKGNSLLALMVVIIPSITALCNALGRIGYSTISDKMKDRATVYKIIFISSMCITSFTLNSIQFNWLIAPILVILLLIIINAGYGGGFSTLPALLSQNFGMNNISKIHGIALTAWAIAGITGNNLSEIVLKNSNNNYKFLLPITIVLYFISFMCSFNASKKVKTN